MAWELSGSSCIRFASQSLGARGIEQALHGEGPEVPQGDGALRVDTPCALEHRLRLLEAAQLEEDHAGVVVRDEVVGVAVSHEAVVVERSLKIASDELLVHRQQMQVLPFRDSPASSSARVSI